ncbi:MAG TPA: gamma carbonic anhydrase family protein [Chroococcales cyanobacterium]
MPEKIQLKDEVVIHSSVFVAPTATVVGEVKVGEGASIWYGAVVRGDMAPVTIGENTNIQDGALLHTNFGYPLILGKNITVGHGAILHGAKIGDNALIGMGAIVLDGAFVGEGAVIGAGAVVGEGRVIPPGTLFLGVPAKPVREVSPEEKERILRNAEHYREYALLHRKRAAEKG